MPPLKEIVSSDSHWLTGEHSYNMPKRNLAFSPVGKLDYDAKVTCTMLRLISI